MAVVMERSSCTSGYRDPVFPRVKYVHKRTLGGSQPSAGEGAFRSKLTYSSLTSDFLL